MYANVNMLSHVDPQVFKSSVIRKHDNICFNLSQHWFTSIQSSKYLVFQQVFTPDKSNGMDVQSESDAKLDYDRKQKEMAILSSLGKNRYIYDLYTWSKGDSVKYYQK